MPASTAAALLPFPKPVRPNDGRPASAVADHEAPLIRRAQAGDRDALGELCARHLDHVRGFLAGRLRGRPADVDDLVGETFLLALEGISTFDPERPGEFGNWLIGIARNKLLHWRRSSQRDAGIDERCTAAAASAAPVSPEAIALDRLELAERLARLEPRARRALLLHHAVGLSSAEVALALGTTKRSILALTGQARTELRGAKLCACGCGHSVRPERWGRDRYASVTCSRRPALAPAPVAERRSLDGPLSTDPDARRVLVAVRAAGEAGITRKQLRDKTRLLACHLDRVTDLLTSRGLVSVVLEERPRGQAMRYRACTAATTRRAA